MQSPILLTINNLSRSIQQRKPQQTSVGVLNLFSVTGKGFPPQKFFFCSWDPHFCPADIK